jgi:hypothetical protein
LRAYSTCRRRTDAPTIFFRRSPSSPRARRSRSASSFSRRRLGSRHFPTVSPRPRRRLNREREDRAERIFPESNRPHDLLANELGLRAVSSHDGNRPARTGRRAGHEPAATEIEAPESMDHGVRQCRAIAGGIRSHERDDAFSLLDGEGRSRRFRPVGTLPARGGRCYTRRQWPRRRCR